ncbi:MAG: urease accessory protein UreF [Pseudonocardiales bacterium]|nr:MAG: urease accessory protein UreF [Pseudonocardiales bacterium]
MNAAALLVVGGQMPSAGHAHSGGIEEAVAAGLVADVDGLAVLLGARLAGSGLVGAGLAAAAAAGWDLARLDAEADARLPSPAQRAASRAQGRALARAGARAWPQRWPAGLGDAPHHPVAVGVCVGDPAGAALAAAHLSISGPATAALRLLGFDPLAVGAALAGFAGRVETVAAGACAAVHDGRLPDDAAPWLDVLAEAHAKRARTGGVSLFAS